MLRSKTKDEFPFKWPSGTRSMFPEGDDKRLLDDPRDVEFGTGNGLNPILFAMRLHKLFPDNEPENQMPVIDQWAHWMQHGDQEVSDDPAHIRHAEQIIGRLYRLTLANRAACMHLSATVIEHDTYKCDSCEDIWVENDGENPNRG